MDLTGMIQNPTEIQGDGQRMSKEEYAAMKKTGAGGYVDADRRPGTGGVPGWGIFAEVPLDFMGGQYNMPRVPNLLLLYSQNPELQL